MNENRPQSNFPRIVEAVKRRSDGAVLLTGVLVVGIAAALAAPRATEPDALSLPLPTPDRARLRKLARAERERAAEARRHALSFAARSVGEMLRRVGDAEGRPNSNVPAAIADLRALARRALRDEGPSGLLALRAVQSELFVNAAREWAARGAPSTELRELGGDFAELSTKSVSRDRSNRLRDILIIGGAAAAGGAAGAVRDGAVIGAVLGGSAGTGGVLLDRGDHVLMKAGTEIGFRLAEPAQVEIMRP